MGLPGQSDSYVNSGPIPPDFAYNINKYRDLELNNVKSAKKMFGILHFLSVSIFILQLVLCLVLFFN